MTDRPEPPDGGAPAEAAPVEPTPAEAAPVEPTPAEAAPVDDEPFLADEPAPAAATADDLREAVGVPRRGRTPTPVEPAGDVDDDPPPRRRGRGPLIAAIAAVVGLLIASLVFLGRSNASRWYFVCGESRITAERGRAFPPWGSEAIGGAEWRPIAIPPGAECASKEADDRAELAGWYLDALVAQAQAKLTAKEVTGVDAAQAELEQALLLARDPERRDERKEIDRLLGDVEYWRGAARVRAALETLDQAAKHFGAASDKRPRHASDAGAWADWVRAVAAELRGGPGGAMRDDGAEPVFEPARPAAPPGVALPVEAVDAGVAAPEAPEPAIDAGVPRGGVLL